MSGSLDALFRPRSIAVVGASRKRGSVGAEIFRNLLRCDFPGPVYPINPKARVVQSVRTHASIHDVPDDVDLAIVVVPGRIVPRVVDECIEKGVQGLIVISAGFGEVGPEGKAKQDALLAKVRENGVRMVGPNCLGLISNAPDCPVNATFAPTTPVDGTVAFSSQSGALGVAILDHAQSLGIGVRQFMSVGNKADVSGNDLLEYWDTNPDIRVILLYLESFGNPRRFMRLARRISRKKPIVVVKAGRTEAGARAASSHTGSLAGLDLAVDALLGQAGVIRTDTIEGLFDIAMLLANQPVPAGDRVAILTNAGGPGIMASDACASRGLSIPSLSPETEARLREFLAAEASIKNPVDMLAEAGAAHYERAIRIVLEDEGIDSLIVIFVPPTMVEAASIAEAIQKSAAGATKPVLTSFLGAHGVPAALSSLRERRFPSYAFPEAAAVALARAVQYGQWKQKPEGTIPTLEGVSADDARGVLQTERQNTEKGRWLIQEEVRGILGAYGIPSPLNQFAATAEESARAAEDLGLPVALKLASDTITHKSDVGGVSLDLDTPEAVRASFAEIEAHLEQRGLRDQMAGVTVQKMLPPAVETFIGVTQDPKFGPLIGFGIGGVNIEFWKDVVFRVQPITEQDAREMLEQIRGVKLLHGFRGGPPADREALVDTLCRVSRLIRDMPEISELDINPLFALPPGQGVVAVDARIRIKGTSNDDQEVT